DPRRSSATLNTPQPRRPRTGRSCRNTPAPGAACRGPGTPPTGTSGEGPAHATALPTSPSSRDQRGLECLPPCLGLRVVSPERRAELPVRPADPQALGFPGHEPRPPRPRRQVGLLVGAELPEEHRPVLRLGPRRGLLHLSGNRRPLGVRPG